MFNLITKGKNMKKVIIRTREDELTEKMYGFGLSCVYQFRESLKNETYGKDWNSCSYCNEDYKLSCCVQLLKTGTISACVFTR